jgi:hypothetical protein
LRSDSARLESIPRIGARRDGRFADWGLPDWGLANRHLAELGLLIDGLWARDIGSAGGSNQGKRCTRYNHSFHHGTFSSRLEEARQNLLRVPLSDTP